jgi:hypothetical protein
MLELAGLNYWAIAVAWLITAAIGAFWYSPIGFGKQWMQRTGVNIFDMPDNEATRVLGSVIVAALVQAVGLAIVINTFDTTTIGEGLIAGAVLWAGLTGATTVGNTLYSRRGWGFWWINNSYYLLVTAANSILLATWR